jgi:hypothetical protein
MPGRHELKHYISLADAMQLRARLRAVARPDANAESDGAYKIRSLYFDNYSDKAIIDKLSGQSRREKFRLRYYKDDPTAIRLEKKSKINKMCYKEGVAITAEECAMLLAGQYEFLQVANEPLFNELYAKMMFQNLRPRNIVDYRREAYVYPAGNVRVTIDRGIRASNSVAGFLSPDLTTIPATEAIILEVKYDGFLPDIVRDIVQLEQRNQSEFSKYLVARFV